MTESHIGFVLSSPIRQPQPSTRIAVLNILPLLQSDLRTSILFEPTTATEFPNLEGVAKRAANLGCDIVVMQKVHGPPGIALARELRSLGIRSLYLTCDHIDNAMAQAVDRTVTVTDYLRSLYLPALQANIEVVHDGIEEPQRCKQQWRTDAGSPTSPLRACLVTSARLTTLPVLRVPPRWLQLHVVGRYDMGEHPLRTFLHAMAADSRESRWAQLSFALSRNIRQIPWSLQRTYEELESADIGTIPIAGGPCTDTANPPMWMRKSENRLTLMMAAGLPVVATPIPAYESVIEQGVTGFLARSRADWLQALEQLRRPELRRSMGQAARQAVLQRFSKERQAQRLLGVLRSLEPR